MCKVSKDTCWMTNRRSFHLPAEKVLGHLSDQMLSQLVAAPRHFHLFASLIAAMIILWHHDCLKLGHGAIQTVHLHVSSHPLDQAQIHHFQGISHHPKKA